MFHRIRNILVFQSLTKFTKKRCNISRRLWTPVLPPKIYIPSTYFENQMNFSLLLSLSSFWCCFSFSWAKNKCKIRVSVHYSIHNKRLLSIKLTKLTKLSIFALKSTRLGQNTQAKSTLQLFSMQFVLLHCNVYGNYVQCTVFPFVKFPQ